MIHFAQTPKSDVAKIDCDEPAAESWHPELLASAQQYLQALQIRTIPAHELQEAWDTFYRTFDPLVRQTVSFCRVRQPDVADCIQEAWAEIATKLPGLRYDPRRGRVKSWLRIVVHRAACHHARRAHRHTAVRIDQDLSALTCPRTLGPAMTTQREELRASVRITLDAFRTRVSSTTFRVLIMTTVEGQTSTEVGKLLGLSPGQVRVTRHRTAQKLRQFIAARLALADAFGISPPLPNVSGETSENQSPNGFSKSEIILQPSVTLRPQVANK